MIDEDLFRALLAEAAAAAPAPGRLPDDLLAGVTTRAAVPEPRFRLSRGRVLVSAAAALVLLVGIASVLADRDPDDRFTSTASTAVEESADEDAYTATTLALPYASGGQGATAAPTAAADNDAAGDAAGAGTGAGAAAPDSALVVKTGSLVLEVARGTYDRTLDLMTTKAVGLGGYVAQSSTSRNDGRPAGALVLRVPAAQFDGYLADVRELGEVVSEDTQGTDVSGQHADLEARLSALRATRDRLGTVLAEADTVEEILAVQDRITGVQTQIEQLEGQLGTIDDQVAMASLTVRLGEPGAQQIEPGDDDRGLGGAWGDARRRFGDGIEAIVSWSGSAAVVALVILVLALALRLGRDRLRRFLL